MQTIAYLRYLGGIDAELMNFTGTYELASVHFTMLAVLDYIE